MPTHRIYSQLIRDSAPDRREYCQAAGVGEDLVTTCRLSRRQVYGVFKLMPAGLARPHVANAMSGDMLRPFRCDYICTTLRTVTTHYSTHGQADRCDLTHVSLSFLNVALTKSSESRSLRLQHHAEVKRWSCSFRPWCRRAHRRRPGGPPGTQFRDSTALHRRLQGPFFIGSQDAG